MGPHYGFVLRLQCPYISYQTRFSGECEIALSEENRELSYTVGISRFLDRQKLALGKDVPAGFHFLHEDCNFLGWQTSRCSEKYQESAHILVVPIIHFFFSACTCTDDHIHRRQMDLHWACRMSPIPSCAEIRCSHFSAP